MSGALEALCTALGVVWAYRDGAGRDRIAPPESRAGACTALGFPAASEAEAADSLARLLAARAARPVPEWHVCTPDFPPDLAPARPWSLRCEDGTCHEGNAGEPLPPLPPGLHRLEAAGSVCTMICAPPALPLPARGWGLMAPLYGLWEGAPAGLGSYGQLASLACGAAATGADFVGINPVHAGFPCDPMAFSPYAPSHRRRLNLLHVTPGQDETGPTGPLIDHPRAVPARLAALETAFAEVAAAGMPLAFEEWRRDEGAALERFCTHQALSEVFGPYWHLWPEAMRRPDAPEVAAFARDHALRLCFHAWGQWQAARQLSAAQAGARAAGMAHGLYLDLAVGTHHFGAEIWSEQGASASGEAGVALFPARISLGAPPDPIAPQGQNWSIATFSPRGLTARGFAPLAETLRAQMRHAGILRIDHILGFERAFWVPEGLPGLYVAMPRDAMLAVTRLEAFRAGALVVGEDLGAVPPGLRAALAASGILGCRVAWLERDWDGTGEFLPPEDWEEAALASLSTHDLPTWAGWRVGREIAWRARLGLVDAEASTQAHAARAREVEGFARAARLSTPGRAGWLGALARAGSRLVAVQAEDVLDSLEQANLPGTVLEHPNWRRRLAASVAALVADPRLAEAGRIMARHGRGDGPDRGATPGVVPSDAPEKPRA
ncbi:MAG: 4-alpha-glucanotransferase [Rhodobacteraceae bacterium]|nr:4-alpha-glucanotransferase [Paracoccaceae bacterium]